MCEAFVIQRWMKQYRTLIKLTTEIEYGKCCRVAHRVYSRGIVITVCLCVCKWEGNQGSLLRGAPWVVLQTLVWW